MGKTHQGGTGIKICIYPIKCKKQKKKKKKDTSMRRNNELYK